MVLQLTGSIKKVQLKTEEFENKLTWLRQMLEWQKELKILRSLWKL